MAEKSREEQLQDAENKKYENAKLTLEKLKNKESKFLFFIPSSENPAVSVYEIYFHATTIKNEGYDVSIITDSEEYQVPSWIESELTDFEHIAMDKIKLTVGPQDVLVVPEVFSNVLEKTQNLPSIRVVFFQSVDFALNSLLPATDWSNFGVKNVVTTSKQLEEFVTQYFGENKFNTKIVSPSIPDYFHSPEKPKQPIVSIVGRNQNDINKVIKLFFLKYPQYSWVSFDAMTTNSRPPTALSREDFAERLRNNVAAIWVDRISSFGTFPLECMKSETIVVGLMPDITPDYLIDNSNKEEIKIHENTGVWTEDLYMIPVLLANVIAKFLDDTIDEKVYESMKEISSKYSPENSKKQVIETYQSFIDERISIIEKAVSDYEKAMKEKETVEQE